MTKIYYINESMPEGCGQIRDVTHLILDNNILLKIYVEYEYLVGCSSVYIEWMDEDNNILFPYSKLGDISGLETLFVIPIPSPASCRYRLKLEDCCDVPTLPPSSPGCPPLDPRPYACDITPQSVLNCGDCTENIDKCNTDPIPITDPLVMPFNNKKPRPYNNIILPKEFTITIKQNECNLCVRLESPVCTQHDHCECSFWPYIEMTSLSPTLYAFQRFPDDHFIGVDQLCNANTGEIIQCPQFEGVIGCPENMSTASTEVAENCKTFQLFYQHRFFSSSIGVNFWGASPALRGPGGYPIIYDTTGLPFGSWIRIHSSSSAQNMRNWICENLRFYTCGYSGEDGVNTVIPNLKVNRFFPHSNLFWKTDCYLTNLNADENTVYIQIIPDGDYNHANLPFRQADYD